VDLQIDGAVSPDQGATPEEKRGLGALQESEARRAQESFREIADALEHRFAFVAGAAFAHKEAQQE
jgi:hypothetical protein